MTLLSAIPYNTLVVAAGVAAVGFAAGVIGCLGVLRRRALVGDAAAHATLIGVALAFLVTGRRDLPVLLLGGFVSAVASLGVLVFLRRWTRTRDDAATAIVLGVSFGLGITLISGITARGIAQSAGLEQLLLGHTAALTAGSLSDVGGWQSVAALPDVSGLAGEAVLHGFDLARLDRRRQEKAAAAVANEAERVTFLKKRERQRREREEAAERRLREEAASDASRSGTA